MPAYHGKAPRGTTSARQGIDPVTRRVVLALMGLRDGVKTHLLAMTVRAGLQVMHWMFEEELEAKVGPKGKHDPKRQASRHGTDDGEVVLGGRKLRIRRPRARTRDGKEVVLETYRQFQEEDPLNEAVVERMLRGVATRGYAGTLESLRPEEEQAVTSVSKSAISRRFRRMTAERVRELLQRPLDALDLVAVVIDGVVVADHTVVAAIGVDIEGRKHLLGLWEGATENAAVCKALLDNLVERGLNATRGLLVVIDGSKALRRAVRDVLGPQAVVQRCQVHKLRNVLDHLPKEKHLWVRRKMAAAWAEPDAVQAEASLRALADALEREHPGAAASLREGLEETLTINRLGLSATLRRHLRSTNIIESAISMARATARRVKRWRNGEQVLRWAAAGLLEAEARFRRLGGYRDLPLLRAALRREASTPLASEAASA